MTVVFTNRCSRGEAGRYSSSWINGSWQCPRRAVPKVCRQYGVDSRTRLPVIGVARCGSAGTGGSVSACGHQGQVSGGLVCSWVIRVRLAVRMSSPRSVCPCTSRPDTRRRAWQSRLQVGREGCPTGWTPGPGAGSVAQSPIRSLVLSEARRSSSFSLRSERFCSRTTRRASAWAASAAALAASSSATTSVTGRR